MKAVLAGLFEQIYDIVGRIPCGRVTTYGQIALIVCTHARTVGWAMRAAPGGLPCHRVIRSDGKLAPEGVFADQRGLLASEGVPFLQDGRVDLKNASWSYIE